MSDVLVLVVVAVLYGASMKAADLHNEHGVRWFRNAGLVFGVVWGVSGSVLLVLDMDVGNVLLAMVVAFLVRLRLDYRNHAIAAAMMIVTFLLQQELSQDVFLSFLFFFVVFGGAKDYLDDVTQRRDWLYQVSEFMWYYLASTLAYAVVMGAWQVFFVFVAYVVSYNVVKYRWQPASAG